MTPSDANVQPVKVLRDNDSHWYVIPTVKYERWIELVHMVSKASTEEQEQRVYDKFEEEFGKYRTGGDLNNIQLFAQI